MQSSDNTAASEKRNGARGLDVGYILREIANGIDRSNLFE